MFKKGKNPIDTPLRPMKIWIKKDDLIALQDLSLVSDKSNPLDFLRISFSKKFLELHLLDSIFCFIIQGLVFILYP